MSEGEKANCLYIPSHRSSPSRPHPQDEIVRYFGENMVFRWLMDFIYFCKYINEKRALGCRFTASISYLIFLAILTKRLII
jgi:hypothetical protein